MLDLVRRCGRFVLALPLAALGIAAVPSANASARSLMSVTIGYPTSTIHILPLYVGVAKGIFAKYGLSVKVVQLGNSQTVNTALASGSVDFAVDSGYAVTTAVSQNAPIESILGYDNGVPLQLIASKSFASAHHLTPKSAIKRIMQSLAGSNEGYAGLSNLGEGNVLLRDYHINPADIHQVNLNSGSALFTELQQGRIDWFLESPPTGFQAAEDGFGVVLASSKNVPSWRVGILNLCLAANRPFAESHVSLARRVAQAVRASVDEVKAHSLAVEPIAAANFPGVSGPDLVASMHLIQWDVVGTQSAKTWARTIAFDVESGLLPSSHAVTKNLDWTNKYL